jgi:hypothetical protein
MGTLEQNVWERCVKSMRDLDMGTLVSERVERRATMLVLRIFKWPYIGCV